MEAAMEWYLAVLKKYVDFSGRARRKEYWMFFLFNIIVSVVVSLVGYVVAGSNGQSALGGIYSLAVLLPSLGVTARRLHDTGRSGWWILIGLVPFIGWLVLLLFLIEDSKFGDNQYGPNPKETMTPPAVSPAV
jgi:uncharacterized membrane protein YhaH (DUF805 family)